MRRTLALEQWSQLSFSLACLRCVGILLGLWFEVVSSSVSTERVLCKSLIRAAIRQCRHLCYVSIR